MTKDTPIITSLMDTDFYKLTMGQLAFMFHPDVDVTYAFKNRTFRVKLAEELNKDELYEQLAHVRTLRFTKPELIYLRGVRLFKQVMFDDRFVDFLETLQLPEFLMGRDNDGQYFLEFEGKWPEAIYWETLALSIVNELYYRNKLKKMTKIERESVYAQGIINLEKKISVLKKNPEITFIEFGTRRRFSKEWQYRVIEILAEELPETQFRGTSNTFAAMKYGLEAMGTSAHEMDMVYSGIFHDNDDDIRNSHRKVLDDWYEMYGSGLSVALTDTYGSAFFFRDMTDDQAKLWRGLRQDSGDPAIFGEQAIEFYESKGLDPTKKMVIFSDGLEIQLILDLAVRFKNRLGVSFGWGTNLTNDLGLDPLSLVIKAVKANGHGTVKLSDNSNKATGKPEDIERFKKIFGVGEIASAETKY